MMVISVNVRTRVCLPFDGEYQLLEDTGVEEQVGAYHPVQLVLKIQKTHGHQAPGHRNDLQMISNVACKKPDLSVSLP